MYHIVDPHETNKEDTKASPPVASFHASTILYYPLIFLESTFFLFTLPCPMPNFLIVVIDVY
jgi:hypothetical protein